MNKVLTKLKLYQVNIDKTSKSCFLEDINALYY